MKGCDPLDKKHCVYGKSIWARAFAIIVAFALSTPLSACAQNRSSETSVAASASAAVTTHEVRIGAGIACNVQGIDGFASYSVRDIGKPGVPAVSASDSAMVQATLHYVHPPTLRFSYVPRFIVFDARQGACPGAPYDVLNEKGCNLAYQPSDGKHSEFAAPGGCFARPRPWIPHDVGNPNAPPWSDYNTNH
jgi:hypothetical protein